MFGTGLVWHDAYRAINGWHAELERMCAIDGVNARDCSVWLSHEASSETV